MRGYVVSNSTRCPTTDQLTMHHLRERNSPWRVPGHHGHNPSTTIQTLLNSPPLPPSSTKSSSPCPHSLDRTYAAIDPTAPHYYLHISISISLTTSVRNPPRTACRIRNAGSRVMERFGVYRALPCPSHPNFEEDGSPRVS